MARSLAGIDFAPCEGGDRRVSSSVSFGDRGYAKAAVAFVVQPERGSRVITETRVLATSADAVRVFLRYSWAIRLGGGAICRSWLAAIRRRATP
jgi:hypothetical protein